MCAANSTLCRELGLVISHELYTIYKTVLITSEAKLNQAVWHRGTEVRIKRFLAKAMRGEGFTVGVVGGSGTSTNPNLPV